MIEQLQLSNFQAHKRLVLDLSHSVTTIIGPTDHGKSAIYRALKWVCLNESPGQDFIHWGSKGASVTLSTDEQKIERSLQGTTNQYRIGAKEYKAFGRNLPEDVQGVLQLSELNFQGQHSTANEPIPFWFALSPAEVSRQLNQIVNLELIDQTMSRLDSMSRTGRAVLSEREERLDQARKTYSGLRFVPEMEEELSQVLTLEKASGDSIRERDSVQDLISRAEVAQAVVEDASQVCQEFGQLLNQGKEMKDLLKERDDLSRLLKQAEQVEAEASIEVPDPSYLEKLALSAVESRRLAQGLEALLGQVEQAESTLDGLRSRLDKTQAELKALSKNGCPLCGQPLKS